jgi:hypothetical protein
MQMAEEPREQAVCEISRPLFLSKIGVGGMASGRGGRQDPPRRYGLGDAI